jgi:flagellar hook-length control protein FliK
MNLGSLLNRMLSPQSSPDASLLEASRSVSTLTERTERENTASKSFEGILKQRVERQESSESSSESKESKVAEKQTEETEAHAPNEEDEVTVNAAESSKEGKSSDVKSDEEKSPASTRVETQTLPEELLTLEVVNPYFNTPLVEAFELEASDLDPSENLVSVTDVLEMHPQQVEGELPSDELVELLQKVDATQDLSQGLLSTNELHPSVESSIRIQTPLESVLKTEIPHEEALVENETLIPDSAESLQTDVLTTDDVSEETPSETLSQEQPTQSDASAYEGSGEDDLSSMLPPLSGGVAPMVNVSGDKASPKDLNLTPLASQAVQGVQSAYDSANKTMQLQLNPEDLGSLRIQIKQMGEGLISARMVVEHPEALNKLQDQLNDMQRHLESQGVKVEKMEVVLAGANSQASKDSSEGERPTSFQQSMNGESDFKQSHSDESARPQEDLAFTVPTVSETLPSTEQVQERLSELNALRQRYTQAESKTGISNPFTSPAPSINLTQGVNILA